MSTGLSSPGVLLFIVSFNPSHLPVLCSTGTQGQASTLKTPTTILGQQSEVIREAGTRRLIIVHLRLFPPYNAATSPHQILNAENHRGGRRSLSAVASALDLHSTCTQQRELEGIVKGHHTAIDIHSTIRTCRLAVLNSVKRFGNNPVRAGTRRSEWGRIRYSEQFAHNAGGCSVTFVQNIAVLP